MELYEESTRGIRVLAIKGRIDSTTAPDLERTMIRGVTGKQNRLVLDLSRTDYVSSAGLRVLLAIRKQLDQARGKFVLHGLNGRVREVFEISGFVSSFSIGAD